MILKNSKIREASRLIMLSAIIFIAIGYFSYSYVKCYIFKELSDSNVGLDNARIIVKIIKDIRIIALLSTSAVITISALTIYKLVNDRFTAQNVDYLTEINSRRYYDIKLDKQIQEFENTKKPFSLMMIDVDYFKKINDMYGHAAGDLVLKQLAEIIKSNTRAFDVCCRLGGDEFVVILPDTSKEEAKLIARRIKDNLKKGVCILDQNSIKNVNITISIGITEYKDGLNSGKLFKIADAALYNSKTYGRNRITVY